VSAPLPWTQLFRIACRHIRQANSEDIIIDQWTFGGGTAMMLQIDHRESHDIDIFLSDPQQLAFLDPQKHDFQFEIYPDAYEGDGARSLRLVFDKIGEIDYIVAGALTSAPTTESNVEGETVLLETIPEIITKKIFYRGSSIKPRDIFDIAAAGMEHRDSLIRELQSYRDQVTETLATIERLNVDFVNGAIAQLAIKDRYKEIAKAAIPKSKEILRAV
jgi:Nucleotidyl transferase AbiEii toxin, Type IV TA system